MYCFGKEGIILLICFWCLPASGAAQLMAGKDTVAGFRFPPSPTTGPSLVLFRIDHDLDYTFSFTSMLFRYWQQGPNRNFVTLFQSFKYRSCLYNNRSFKVTTSFVHELGVQYFFDSVFRFQPDDTRLDTRIEITVLKNLTATIVSNLSTRIFNNYLHVANSTGNLEKRLQAAFLTPFLCTFSAGWGWKFLKLVQVTLGISASKFTWIRNKEIYAQQHVSQFYGVPENKGYLFEYGLTFTMVAEKELMKNLNWNLDLQIFKNYKKPADVLFRNYVGFKVTRFFKITLQTRLCYEHDVSYKVQIENLFSLGLYFHP